MTELTPFITKLIEDGIITQEQIDSKQFRIDSINEAFSADSEVRRILLYGGARSSKTFRSTNKVVARALHYPGSRHLIARDTYAAVRSSMLEDTFPKLLRLKYPTLYKLFTKTSRKEVIKVGMNWGTSTFIFPNGSMIVFKGIGNEKDVEKLLGTEYMTILMDEANMVNYLSVQKLRTRLAQKCYHYKTGKEGKLLEIDICNPPSKSSWLYKEYFQLVNPLDPEIKLYSNEYFHCQLNPIDNIENIPEDFIIQLTRLHKAQQKRFLFGEFRDIVEGGIFSNEIALNLHKIGLFKRNPAYETFAVFDIGHSDSTALIVFQYINEEWFVLDYLEETQKTWPFYCNWIKSKHPYIKRIIFPHDGEVTEWGGGTTRRARAEEDGFQVLIAPKMRQMNQIDLARDNLFNCRFNEETTRRLWECISNATWEHNKENYQFDKAKMQHDEFSHGTSAFIYMITGILKWIDPKQYLTDNERKKQLEEEANRLINKAIDEDMDKVLNPGFDLTKVRNDY